MGSKIDVACRFAGIGALTDAAAILAGEAGTRIRR